MNRTTYKNTILVCALLGIMIAGPARGATIRYRQSGDWTETAPLNDRPGWQNVSSVPTTADLGRINWGNNTVTLTNDQTIGRLQVGVDERGNLVIANGGTLTTVAGSGQNGDLTIGQGNNPVGTGAMTVESGGTLNVANILYHGNIANGTSEIFGTVNVGSHLWTGWTVGAIGTININNGGVLNVSGQLGLNWRDNGAVGYVNVKDGGVLNLSQIHNTDSIRGSSVLDISGSGVVTILGEFTNVISGYVSAGRITANGGKGKVNIDYDNMNAGMTTLFATAGEEPPVEVVWSPAANPTGGGTWAEDANWTGGRRPGYSTKVIFNVPGAIPCLVTNTSMAGRVVSGDSGPGGTLIITNGAALTVGDLESSVIGYNNTGEMVVESGASASFGNDLYIGQETGSDGALTINGGTVSVAGTLGLGWSGGKGTVHVNGGTLMLAQMFFPQGESVLDVAGTGKVVITGYAVDLVEFYVSIGQITANGGTNVYYSHDSVSDETTIAAEYIAPVRTVWNPALNPSSTGSWKESANWSDGLPGSGTKTVFNVPDATNCWVTDVAITDRIVVGDGGPGGMVIVTNGGSLTMENVNDWSAISYNDTSGTATMVVEEGGSASFGNHLWIGHQAGAIGTLIMNGGTVSVGQQFGLGWSGGTGTAQIKGGTLNLFQIAYPQSISATSVLDISGTAKVLINGDRLSAVSSFIADGKITANGGPIVYYAYDSGANKTTISAELLPAPRQAITVVSVSDGNVTVTYQTTPQHTYYIESAPSLSPASWTPVPGSTNVATGNPVTFTFPASAGQMFYRTVSP